PRRHGLGRYGRREAEPEVEDRQRDEEPRDRTRGADVDEGAAGPRQAAEPDDGAERSDERKHRSRNEERPGRIDPVPAREDEVAHLVGEEDGDERSRERETVANGLARGGRRKLGV